MARISKWQGKCKTRATNGEVIQRIQGGYAGAINPPTTHYYRVVDDGGHDCYDPKTVVEVTYDEYKGSKN